MRPLFIASTLTLLVAACHSDDGKPADTADSSTDTALHPSTAGDAGFRLDASTLDASKSDASTPPADVTVDGAAATPLALPDAGLEDASLPLGAPDGGAHALGWTACDKRFECTSVEVPLDYDDATAGSLQIAVRRLVSTSPKRIGSLLTNPGGPGASAVDSLTQWVEQDGVSAALLEHFDLVAFDPRGVGASTPLVCHSTLQKLYATDPDPDNEAEWQALIAASQTFADECTQKNKLLAAHMTTREVARDMDRVRIALGEDELSYLGFSYGTLIGAWYAELFPTHVRALVLDGPLDPKLSSLDITLQQAKGFELSL
ncbi:MAG: hypothetical protein JWN04_289, partial [Myxococcaceae bacterium]|nr:hypothetical protein [Myxococcaceae bacterium]